MKGQSRVQEEEMAGPGPEGQKDGWARSQVERISSKGENLVPARWRCLWIHSGPAVYFPQNGKRQIVKRSLLEQGIA